MPRWNVYVGGVTHEVWNHFPAPEPNTIIPSKGIERFVFDDATGSLIPVDSAGDDLSSPQYVELHPTLPVLYAAEFASPSRVVSFDIGRDGQLARRSIVDSRGTMAIAVGVHPTGTHAYVAHFGDGVLTACRLDDDGGLTAAEPVVSPSAVESHSKLHHVRVTHNGDKAVVADFGSDEVVTYAIDDSGMLSSQPIGRVRFPTGSRPRHIEFHPSGRIVYVVGEGDARLHVLQADDFAPQRILHSQPTAPANAPGASPSEMRLHPDGSTLFVGVRRADCITAFAVDEAGVARTLYHQPSGGQSPRAVSLDPSGRHLLVGNWHSNRLVVFAIDGERGLTPVDDPIEAHSPSSIVFAPASS